MTLPTVTIEKSKTPIVWLDTSIITNMTILRKSPEKLEQVPRNRIEKLYNLVYEYGRAGRIICPLAEQEGEVWINRSDWMDTIRELSLGIECVRLKDIQDRQLHRAMKAFVSNEPSITLSYLDAFDDDPVAELQEVLQQPVFITVDYDIFLGADYRRDSNTRIINALNERRENNIKQGVIFEEQFASELVGEIQEVVKMARELTDGIVEDERGEFNKMGAWINLRHQLLAWEHISGKANDLEGLISFHKSDYNKVCPYVKLSCSLYAKIMIDPQPIKSGDPMDITHISTLMPFSDLFITDKHWSTFLNRKSFSKEYDTTIAYVGNTDEINGFFQKVA